MSTFDQLGLAEPLLRAVHTEGYTTPTPIQAQAIPLVRDGFDLLGCAQTGTGKTAAFALPVLHRLFTNKSTHAGRPIRCLVLTPTRELATQVGDSFRAYGRNVHLLSTVIFGGVGQHPQVQALRRGVDIVVACPGRLIDLMNQGHVRLDGVEVLILDEADRMLDMGFLPDIRRILTKIPQQRQTLFFSATMPREIRELANGILRQPKEVTVAPVSSTAETVEQCVYHVAKARKQALLTLVLGAAEVTRALIFTRTKHGADKVARQLTASGIRAEAIHGNKSQNARQRALEQFRNGHVKALVASDIASRGLDIDGVTHVVNFDVPNEPETYVHRIGRTGRAGASGIALSLCDADERGFLASIERLTRRRIPVVEVPANLPHLPPPPATQHQQGGRQFGQRRDFAPRRDGGGGGGGGRREGGGRDHRSQRSEQHGDSAPRHDQAQASSGGAQRPPLAQRSVGQRPRQAVFRGR